MFTFLLLTVIFLVSTFFGFLLVSRLIEQAGKRLIRENWRPYNDITIQESWADLNDIIHKWIIHIQLLPEEEWRRENLKTRYEIQMRSLNKFIDDLILLGFESDKLTRFFPVATWVKEHVIKLVTKLQQLRKEMDDLAFKMGLIP